MDNYQEVVKRWEIVYFLGSLEGLARTTANFNFLAGDLSGVVATINYQLLLLDVAQWSNPTTSTLKLSELIPTILPKR